MSELQSIAQSFSGLPIDSLIGGPLMAAAKANNAMCLTQTKLMLDTCFSAKRKDPNDPTSELVGYEPILIKMTLKRGIMLQDDQTGEAKMVETTTEFELPILTIVPINSLAVQTIDVNFEMEVKSSFAEDTSKTKESELKAEASFEAKVGYGPFSASIRGSVSYAQKDSETRNTHYEKSNSAKYTIAVHAGQLPIPKGVNTIIDAFASCIQPIEMPQLAQKST